MSLVPALDQPTASGREIGKKLRLRLGRDLKAAAFAIGLFFVAGGGWAYFTEISGAVVGTGRVIAEAQLQRVQYLDGGILETLYVKNGDKVEANQLLARMNTTALQAQFDIARNRVIESYLLLARTAAELNGEETIEVPEDLRKLVGDIDFGLPLQSQIHILKSRLKARATENSLYEKRVTVAEETLQSSRTIVQSLNRQMELSQEEVDVLSDLLKKGLTQRTRVLDAERDMSDLGSTLSQAQANLANAESGVASAKLQVNRADEDARKEILQLQQDTRAQLSEQINQYQTQKSALARAEIRAPRSGIVHQLAVNTPGQVVAPGGDLMMIVPSEDELILEAKIRPSEVDQVYAGQPARVRVGVYDARLLREIAATVTFVSPDVVVDQASQAAYYAVKLRIDDGEIEKLGDIALVPGMPITAFMQNQERTVLSFLIDPLVQRMESTFRD